MKYKSIYLNFFSFMLRKILIEQYGKEIAKKSLKGARKIYREMLEKCDDIGADNPMAGNIYMCFVFLAIWDAADGAIDVESYRTVIKKFVRSPIARLLLSGKNINRSEDMRRLKERFHTMQKWADTHPEYKEKTWDFNFDDSKHKVGSYYYFTRCPIEAFARKNGYLEVLPVCCDIDYLTIEANHGILHRDYTLASGGDICDYWIVPDMIENPK